MKAEGKRPLRVGFLLAFYTLLGSIGILIAGQLGRFSPLLDVFSHLTSHMVLIAITAIAALWVGRHHVVILGFGAAAILAGHSALSLTPDLSSAKAAVSSSVQRAYADAGTSRRNTPGKLKVVSLNSWHSNRSPDKIVSYLRGVQADVVILIEFGPSKLALLAKLAADYPYQVHCAKRWYCSLALLSRHPISRAKARSPTKTGPAVVTARIALPARNGQPGRRITVVGTHIFRPSTSPRLHVSHLQQLAVLVNNINGPYILAGDFNATPWSQSYRNFVGNTELVTGGMMRPSWPAWPVSLPQFEIDHIFASKGLSIIKRGVGANVGSDHLPVWAIIR